MSKVYVYVVTIELANGCYMPHTRNGQVPIFWTKEEAKKACDWGNLSFEYTLPEFKIEKVEFNKILKAIGFSIV